MDGKPATRVRSDTYRRLIPRVTATSPNNMTNMTTIMMSVEVSMLISSFSFVNISVYLSSNLNLSSQMK